MGTTARSRMMTFLPWVALVAVTLFAFAQVRARQAQPASAPPPTPPVQAPPAPSAGQAGALAAAETALDQALQDLDAARARAVDLESDNARVRARAEMAQARLDAAHGRLEAAEADLDGARAEVTRLEGRLQPVLDRVAALEARRKVVEDRVLRTLADVVSDDAERLRRARETAGSLKAEDLERLAALLVEDTSLATAAALVLPSIPASDDAEGVLVALLEGLEAGEDAEARLAGLGRDHLVRGTLAGRLLVRPETAPWHPALLGWLARNASALDEDARKAFAAPLALAIQDQGSTSRAHAMRLVGVLRQGDQAAVLLAALDDDAPAVRAAAAYALSRAPDREAVDEAAWKAVPGLLGDEDAQVRTAGALLAEAILGRALAFDPTADAATRAKQLETMPGRP